MKGALPRKRVLAGHLVYCTHTLEMAKWQGSGTICEKQLIENRKEFNSLASKH